MGFRLKAVWGKLHRRQQNSNLRETDCVRFGRYASLSAFVLFAGGCVVGICDESFLDFSFSEFFMFLEWRTAVPLILLDCYYRLLSTLRRGQLAPCTPRRAEPARPQFAYGNKIKTASLLEAVFLYQNFYRFTSPTAVTT